MERDSACGYGSREHISKVCSQLIIGAPSFPPPGALLSSPAHHWKDEVPRFEATLLPRTNLHGNRPCAGAIYSGRQIAKRTGAGGTWLSMLCARFSQLHFPAALAHARAPVVVRCVCKCTRKYEKSDRKQLRSRHRERFSLMFEGNRIRE